ncbi:hypothetical protein ALC56_12470 [Trachymyrmex septentrionalis]|uniref:Uncharacterized protein n=1 Tax=Trachymyrmex septentrionalis TaxID=34720 RepID=A0A195EZ04_9HYME|nr:hypothetical protein ALC56_12470 [Trachymyrmex septentrionalis]
MRQQQSSKIPPAGNREFKEAQVEVVQPGSTIDVNRTYQQTPQQGGWVQWCSGCRRASELGVASSTGALAPSAPGPGAAVVGCLVGVYPCSPSSTGPRGPLTHHLQAIPNQQQSIGCRACCCVHSNHQPTSVQLTSQRGGLSLRVARVASTTSVRAAPYAHPQHQGLGQECREETGALGGGGAHILGSPMLFVPFTVPTFPATHHQTTHPAHQSHHQQLQANTQNPVQQPQQLTQLNQLSHLNHQGIVPATTNQPTIHSTSCSPQQQATTPNKVPGCRVNGTFAWMAGTTTRFPGKATRRLPTMARGCAARGEDQSTGDDFITTRHSSTTLKYQKSGGLTQVWQSATRPDTPRGSFLHNTLFFAGLKRLVKLASVSSILPNKIECSALLSHPLALASKLMSSLQHYTVQTLIPSPSHPKAHHLSTPLPVYPLCAVLGLSKPALNHTSANDAARGNGKELS